VRYDVNSALKVYLGADVHGGYQPIGCEERLQRAFPGEHLCVKALLTGYLQEGHNPDWSQYSLAEETARFTDILRRKFPELDRIAARALANRWSFSWR
jgi:hypothetical protein